MNKPSANHRTATELIRKQKADKTYYYEKKHKMVSRPDLTVCISNYGVYVYE